MDVQQRVEAISENLKLLENEALRFKRNCDILESRNEDMKEIAEIWKQYVQSTPLLSTLGQLTRDV